MMQPLVSVIIPTHNRSGLLRRTLESVLAQEYQNLEVVVVDDGSTDDTPQVVRSMDARDHRILYTRHEVQRGAAAARNTGAGMAEGTLILFEDDDCRSEPNRILRLVEALETAPTAAYAYCWMNDHTPSGRVVVRGRDGPWAIGTPYALIRRSVFENTGGFDEGLPRLQDFDLWIRILAQHDAVEVPEVLFETVRAPASISSSTDRLVAAADHMTTKYRHSELTPEHLARMHRYLGGALTVEGRRKTGLKHFRRSIVARPWSFRSWLGLGAAALGPGLYRKLVTIRNRLSRIRAGSTTS